tara:strand:+ start:1092 stop:1433 length:342 start_codon:yes stop_codon:yes gene_type:complete
MSTGQGLRTESFFQVVLVFSPWCGIIGAQKEKTSAALMTLDEDSKFSLDTLTLTWYNIHMDEENYNEYDEGSDIDNWEDEQVFQDKEWEDPQDFVEYEPLEDFGFFGEAGLWD